MIIPTPEYNPMFAQDGIPFREKMLDYIHREFRDTLGPKVGLLNSDAGLEILSTLNVPAKNEPAPIRKAA